MYGAATNVTNNAMYPDDATATRADVNANADGDAKSTDACQCTTGSAFIASRADAPENPDTSKSAGYAGAGTSATPVRSCQPYNIAGYANATCAGDGAMLPGSTSPTKRARSTGHAVCSKQWVKEISANNYRVSQRT